MKSIDARITRLEAATPSADPADMTDVELAREVDRLIEEEMRTGSPELRRRLAEADGRDEQVALLLETPAD